MGIQGKVIMTIGNWYGYKREYSYAYKKLMHKYQNTSLIGNR